MKEVDISESSDANRPGPTGNFRQNVVEAHADGYVTGAEAAEIVGITYRRVDHSARTGIAPPAHDAPGGSGTIRRYDLRSLIRLKIVTDLFDLGLGDSDGLRGVLDQIDNGESVRAVSGCIAIEIDPACARRQLEPKYLSTINPEDQ